MCKQCKKQSDWLDLSFNSLDSVTVSQRSHKQANEFCRLVFGQFQ